MYNQTNPMQFDTSYDMYQSQPKGFRMTEYVKGYDFAHRPFEDKGVK